MNRPKGLALTAILMALCNAMIWATIDYTRPQRKGFVILAVIFGCIIGFFFIWSYWKGRNWARIGILLCSGGSIGNLFMWRAVSLYPVFLATPTRTLLAVRAVLGAALLYYLNTRPVVEFFYP
jgi:drug/metabolite transporter (DMT)-like permease